MTLNFYTLGVLYLVYSFLGWVGETVVATFRGKRFANRGMAAGPFCFVYGTTAILMAVGFADMRTKPVVLFVACMITATVVEWLTAKLLERLHNRKWWDYSDKKFNLNGYVCLQYSVLWGALGMVTVLWGNGLLLRLCALVPDWLLHPLVWAALGIAALDQIGARGFNMECIKSRPLPHVPFENYFYVQIVCPAGSTGAGCQTLLDTLTSVCSTLRLLGAFTLDSTEK